MGPSNLLVKHTIRSFSTNAHYRGSLILLKSECAIFTGAIEKKQSGMLQRD